MTDQPSITCPRCRMTSYNPNDVIHGYCGNCHDWTTPVDLEVMPTWRGPTRQGLIETE